MTARSPKCDIEANRLLARVAARVLERVNPYSPSLDLSRLPEEQRQVLEQKAELFNELSRMI